MRRNAAVSNSSRNSSGSSNRGSTTMSARHELVRKYAENSALSEFIAERPNRLIEVRYGVSADEIRLAGFTSERRKHPADRRTPPIGLIRKLTRARSKTRGLASGFESF